MKYLLLIFVLNACASTSSTTSNTKHEGKADFVLPPAIAAITSDPTRGEKIAKEGANGAVACSSCHGANGAGVASSGFPRLAGQSAMYLATQLRAYQSGIRENPVMYPIAKALSAQDLQDVADYYESVANAPYERAPALTGIRAARAVQITTHGDQKLGLQSCQNCHGPGGIGEAPGIPYLKGQSSTYVKAQLLAWKNGTRKTNPEHMGYISKLLNEQDIETLAAYYQHVPTEHAGLLH